MASKILTRQEAYNIGGSGSLSEPLRCCTRSIAESYGCQVDSSYTDNQLISNAQAQEKKHYIIVELSPRQGTPSQFRSGGAIGVTIETASGVSTNYNWTWDTPESHYIKHEITNCDYVTITVAGSYNANFASDNDTFKFTFTDDSNNTNYVIGTFRGQSYEPSFATGTGANFPLWGRSATHYAYIDTDSYGMSDEDGWWGAANANSLVNYSTVAIDGREIPITTNWNISEYHYEIDPTPSVNYSCSGSAPSLIPSSSASTDVNGYNINLISLRDNVSYPICNGTTVGGNTDTYQWTTGLMNGKARIDGLQISFNRPTTCYSCTAQIILNGTSYYVNYVNYNTSNKQTLWDFSFDSDAYFVVPNVGSPNVNISVSRINFTR